MVHGIDVSHHQKIISWQTVAQQGVHFAFVKATEGESFKDSLFCRNWSEIKKAGIVRGAYHFFRPYIDAQKQAENFIERVHLENGDMAPVLDVEITDGMQRQAIIEGMNNWLQKIEKYYGIRPIIYSNQNFFNKYLKGSFQDYPIWIARYSHWRYPSMMTEQNWDFWQYGNKGILAGVVGYVDFNVFRGNESEFQKFIINSSSPSDPATIPSTSLKCVDP